MWSGPGTAGRRVPGELENEQEKELDTKPTSIAGVLRRQPERRSRRVFRSSYAKASENLEEDLAMQYVAMCQQRTFVSTVKGTQVREHCRRHRVHRNESVRDVPCRHSS